MKACAGTQIETAAAVTLNIVRDANSASRWLKRSDAASASTAATTAAHSGPNSSTEVKTSASESENRVSIRGSFIMHGAGHDRQSGEHEPARAPGDSIIVRSEAIRIRACRRG